MGHINNSDLKSLKDHGVGVDFKSKHIPEFCVPCIQGKHHRYSFKVSKSPRATEKLALVHSDVIGPMKTKSLGGSRYILSFINDFSLKCFLYFLKTNMRSSVNSRNLRLK